jgi:Fe-S cluster assembly protein SufD
VKATHGASIGQLNFAELFYLQSRGVAKDRALNILRQAFAAEIFEKIQPPILKVLTEKAWGKITDSLRGEA